VRAATARDVIIALALFLGPPTAGMLIWIWRSIRSARREMRDFKASAEADATDGYPPAEPTHHRPSKSPPG
jgi:hypothetical protein